MASRIPTRRALLGAITIAPAFSWIEHADAITAVDASWASLARALSALHPDGRRAVVAAQKSGMQPSNLMNVLLQSRSGGSGYPMLMFFSDDGRGVRSFGPDGET